MSGAGPWPLTVLVLGLVTVVLGRALLQNATTQAEIARDALAGLARAVSAVVLVVAIVAVALMVATRV